MVGWMDICNDRVASLLKNRFEREERGGIERRRKEERKQEWEKDRERIREEKKGLTDMP